MYCLSSQILEYIINCSTIVQMHLLYLYYELLKYSMPNARSDAVCQPLLQLHLHLIEA